MSLVAKLKEIIAEQADGAHYALMHLGAEVEKLLGGASASVDVEKLKLDLALELRPGLQSLVDANLSELSENVKATLAAIRGESEGRAAELMASVMALNEKLAALQVQTPNAPADLPPPAHKPPAAAQADLAGAGDAPPAQV